MTSALESTRSHGLKICIHYAEVSADGWLLQMMVASIWIQVQFPRSHNSEQFLPNAANWLDLAEKMMEQVNQIDQLPIRPVDSHQVMTIAYLLQLAVEVMTTCGLKLEQPEVLGSKQKPRH